MNDNLATQTFGKKRPSRAEAEEAVRTLISWAGDDPDREGLIDTPSRVIKAYGEFFAGYTKDPKEILSTTFEEVAGYDELVLVKDIRIESHCEHHMVPIIGTAHVGYMPDERVVGISKLARLVDLYAKRLQTQESITAQVTDALQEALQPRGVMVVIYAEHQCMTMRGVHKPGSGTLTRQMRGCFKEDRALRDEFMTLVGTTHGSHAQR